MFRKILVPTDFSAEGERALPAIARFAHDSGATVVLLHVVENVSVDVARVVPPTAYLPGMQDELEQVRVELERRRGEFHEGVELVLDSQVAASVPEAEVASWEDVDRLDVRPDRGVVKVRSKTRWEVQIDTNTAEILQVAYRRSDLIESLHDGSFFHDKVKLWVFLPAGLILLGLWVTGVYLWLLPYLVRRRRRAW
jgi:nucleotide-binding universal stress UspA family protein